MQWRYKIVNKHELSKAENKAEFEKQLIDKYKMRWPNLLLSKPKFALIDKGDCSF